MPGGQTAALATAAGGGRRPTCEGAKARRPRVTLEPRGRAGDGAAGPAGEGARPGWRRRRPATCRTPTGPVTPRELRKGLFKEGWSARGAVMPCSGVGSASSSCQPASHAPGAAAAAPPPARRRRPPRAMAPQQPWKHSKWRRDRKIDR
ncbi:Protein of unknown function [Gryllus bimaculatus]|nr:Protein of unknown function [Gryllus bimaculatus]